MGKGGGSPDVVGAANTEGEFAREIARDQTYADRPDQYGPFGSTTWEQTLAYDPAAPNSKYQSDSGGWDDRGDWGPFPDDGGGGIPNKDIPDGSGGPQRIGDNPAPWHTGGGSDPSVGDGGGDGSEQRYDDGSVTKWTQRNTLSDDAQRYFDSQMKRNLDLSGVAEGMGTRIGREMGTSPDWEQFGDVHAFDPTANRQSAEDAAYGRATQRLDPRFAKQRADLERQMAGRGLRAGDAAYDSAMQNFNTGRNDAYEMARMGSVGEGRKEFGVNMQANDRANALRRQQIEEYIGKRGFSLDESNKLANAQNMGDMVQTFGGG